MGPFGKRQISTAVSIAPPKFDAEEVVYGLSHIHILLEEMLLTGDSRYKFRALGRMQEIALMCEYERPAVAEKLKKSRAEVLEGRRVDVLSEAASILPPMRF